MRVPRSQGTASQPPQLPEPLGADVTVREAVLDTDISAVPLATQQVTAVNPPIPCDNLNISIRTSPKLLPCIPTMPPRGKKKGQQNLRQGHADGATKLISLQV